MPEYKRWVRSALTDDETTELAHVDALAKRLIDHMETASPLIAAAHVHGARSQSVQAHLSVLLKDELGFDEEVILTPQDGLVTQSRPDFFFRLGDQRVSWQRSREVERRPTIMT